jgi:hypothetical protein
MTEEQYKKRKKEWILTYPEDYDGPIIIPLEIHTLSDEEWEQFCISSTLEFGIK